MSAPQSKSWPIACLIGALLSSCSSGAQQSKPGSPTDDPLSKIEHIVVIYAENRSFDNLYGLFPGANGIGQASEEAQRQVDHGGSVLPYLPPIWLSGSANPDPAFPARLPNGPFRLDAQPIGIALSQKTRDLVHAFYQNQEQINGGKMNRFAAVSDAGGLTMGYYDGSKLPMWEIAKEFTLADNFFMGAFGGSFLNHFWLVCACTPVFPDPPAERIAHLDASGHLRRAPDSPTSALRGPAAYTASRITPDGYAVLNEQPPYQPSGIPPAAGGDRRLADVSKHPLPPQSFKTIGDTLNAKGVSWAWYAGAWNAAVEEGMRDTHPHQVIYGKGEGSPNFQAHHQPFNYFASYAPGTLERAEHLKDGTDFLAAIEAGTLPQVSFYKPQGKLNEHAGYADVLSGDAHIAELVRKIQASPLWPLTAVIVTYDENGGFWDHAAPPKGDRWGPGVRIPAIVVSPFAKRGHVDHTMYDTTSIIKFITRRFGLEPLPGVRPNAGDLSHAFDFGS
ncbi:MAG: acid phosphatase [Methylococcus sp.]|nr:acid phosphatase [Methylococcus sp.]